MVLFAFKDNLMMHKALRIGMRSETRG